MTFEERWREHLQRNASIRRKLRALKEAQRRGDLEISRTEKGRHSLDQTLAGLDLTVAATAHRLNDIRVDRLLWTLQRFLDARACISGGD